jgi:hypothetical protein
MCFELWYFCYSTYWSSIHTHTHSPHTFPICRFNPGPHTYQALYHWTMYLACFYFILKMDSLSFPGLPGNCRPPASASLVVGITGGPYPLAFVLVLGQQGWWWYWGLTQGLILARQALYHLSSAFCFVLGIFEIGSCFFFFLPRLASKLNPPDLCLLSS